MSRNSPAIGRTVLGKYKLTGLLAIGGQAEVYVAVDGESGARFAVKLSKPGSLDDCGEERLKAEAALLARVDSPRIVNYVDSGRDEEMGCFCLVEELAEGVALAHLLAKREIVGPEQLLQILSQVVEGLEALHGIGFIMRDLSPSQVIVDGAAEPIRCTVVDLGLARSISEDTGLTDPRLAAGTPGYSAPELTAGHPPTPASDTYSLAVLAYRMLAGSPPFEAAVAEAVVAMQLAEGFTPLSGIVEVPPLVAARLDGLMRKALSVHPQLRPRTPRAFVEELSHCLNGLNEGYPAGTSLRWPLWAALAMAGAALAAWLVRLLKGP